MSGANNVRLSVVTITYRDASGLKRTLDSLQPLQDFGILWEHVVVDSSPEISAAVLKALLPDWPLRHVPCPARGVYDAMNQGIGTSHGKYLWFLNGGDALYDVQNLKAALAYFENTAQADLLFCPVYFETNAGKKLRAPRKNFLKNLIGKNHIPHQGTLYQKACFEKAGFFSTEYKIASDYEFHVRCFSLGLKAATASMPIALCQMGGVSFTNWRDSLQELEVAARPLRSKIHPAFWLWSKLLFSLHRLECHVLKYRARRTPSAHQ